MNRTVPAQLAGVSRCSRRSRSGRIRNRPGSASVSVSFSSAAHAGWVKSPVPRTVRPLRSAHQDRCSMSQSLLHARENREWICRSAVNMSVRSCHGPPSFAGSPGRPPAITRPNSRAARLWSDHSPVMLVTEGRRDDGTVVESLSPSHPGVPRIAAGVHASFDTMMTTATEAIWTEVPAYPASGDDRLRADVTAHVRAVFATFLAGLDTGQEARRADFGVTREQATRRVTQGIALADFLQAFRVGQLTFWQSVLDAAGQDAAAREAALLSVALIMQVVELGSAVAGEAYMAAQARALAETDRVRRDLLEDLLAGHASPAAGPKRALLRAMGIGPD